MVLVKEIFKAVDVGYFGGRHHLGDEKASKPGKNLENTISMVQLTRPSVNYAKDWLDQFSLTPGLQKALKNHFSVYFSEMMLVKKL